MKTAEQLYYDTFEGLNIEDNEHLIPEIMIKFATLHVTEALKQAAENAKQNHLYFDKEDNYEEYMTNKGFLRKDENGDSYGLDVLKINKDSILNSYPLENIK